MDPELRVADPAKVKDCVEIARAFFCAGTGIEIASPAVVLRTATGVRVMAWLPIENEDISKLNPKGFYSGPEINNVHPWPSGRPVAQRPKFRPGRR